MRFPALFSIAPMLAAALTANNTAVPGMRIQEWRVESQSSGCVHSASLLNSRADSFSSLSARGLPPSYTFYYGELDSCPDDNVGGFTRITGNAVRSCTEFPSPPQMVTWFNPSNPNDPDGKPYWNFILYFHGDSCPVVGHPIQCDTVGNWCLTFPESRPLSFDIVEATTGIRNCDA